MSLNIFDSYSENKDSPESEAGVKVYYSCSKKFVEQHKPENILPPRAWQALKTTKK